MIKTIVFISNPFGYGPTGKAIAVSNSFVNKGFRKIIFVGSSFTQEIMPNNIIHIDCNERNEFDITNILIKIENPVVISSQNRFAIYAANKLGIKSAFIDGLAWFWKKIPSDHLIANEIFWMNYPNIKRKMRRNIHNIHIVPGIVDKIPKIGKRNKILIHIGGCENPISNIFPKNYLDLLSDGISTISHENVLVTGGNRAVEYLRSKLNSDECFIFKTLKHDEFMYELNMSKHFITTAGQTATLEAFALKVPTSFLLPMNLSQFALTNILDKYNASPQKLSWDMYIPYLKDMTLINEKDAIIQFDRYASKLISNTVFTQKYTNDLKRIIRTVPVQKGQCDFIDYVGISGADTIVQHLIDRWSLSI